MTDQGQRIADTLVSAGILHKVGSIYFIQWDGNKGVSVGWADEALSDWRVAGACLEHPNFNIRSVCDDRAYGDVYSVAWLRDPRAICEAFAVSAGRES